MCCPCGFLCCGSDEFGGCGCDDCPDPRCQEQAGEAAPVGLPVNDDDELADDMPLAALPRAIRRFRCEEVRP
ncbi:hypothetical protein [Methylobacterium gnaphalii]|uniref:Uncharacterized protein n=1 Tax=Methylobacterium gnaphalii TaxID=1010610 RepID=A0A512JIU0_9HYPH|nr:hypothetical protein [Methylobacterium gnaphalii]GEP09877.1 hypothetical protein MGN01_17220 [Methylobacterium gnaphalii]GJD67207.1 hypothetical protein MMMDOFMJ_0121 [Methylobacterium gnaphalii]GLS49906.1 hypothetical protein GCM10007885_27580 [Methylobacterium gnaphalii]